MYVPNLLIHMSRTDYAVQNTGVNYKTAKNTTRLYLISKESLISATFDFFALYVISIASCQNEPGHVWVHAVEKIAAVCIA